MKVLFLLVDVFLAWLLAWGTNHLVLKPWRRSEGSHWTERARLLWPARLAAGWNIWTIPLVISLAQSILWPQLAPPLWLAITVALPASIFANYPTARVLFPQFTLKTWLHVTYAGFAIRTLFVAVFVSAVFLMPREFNALAWGIAAAVIALQAALVWGGSLRLLRLVRLLEPAPERVQRIVAATATQMGAPVPRSWISREPVPNALALVFTNELLFTQGIVDGLSDEHLAAVCAHEIGHLTEPKIVLVGRLLSTLIFVPALFVRPLLAQFQLFGVLVMWIAFIILAHLSGRLSRKMETRADLAASSTDTVAGTYAQALARIHEMAHIPAVMHSKKFTHPHLYDRLLAVGMTPDYPRPEPAGSASWNGVLFLVLTLVLAVIYVMTAFPALRLH